MTEAIAIAPQARRRIDVLDYLRFLAALMVMAYHYTLNGIRNGKIQSINDPWPIVAVTKYGYLGVELFFLISGFVILNSARNKTARQFAVGRAVRLYPAFWAGMLFTAVITVFLGSAADLSVSAKQVVFNLTMLPGPLGVPPVDGVYWTLFYEIVFYAGVFMLLFVGLGRYVGQLIPWWAFAMFAIAVLAPGISNLPLAGQHYALFAGGALIAEIRHQGPSMVRVAGLFASASTALPFAYRYAAHLETQLSSGISPMVAAVLVALCYIAMLSLCSGRVSGAALPKAELCGALTYPLYLIHAHVGYIVLSMFATEENRLWVYPMVATGMLFIAYLIHAIVERRGGPWWRRIFDATIGRLVGMLEQSGPQRRSARIAVGAAE